MRARLFELKRNGGEKIYVDEVSWTEKNGDKTTILNPAIIFDHIDGMYSVCHVEKHPDRVLHLQAGTELETYKDGWKMVEDDSTNT